MEREELTLAPEQRAREAAQREVDRVSRVQDADA